MIDAKKLNAFLERVNKLPRLEEAARLFVEDGNNGNLDEETIISYHKAFGQILGIQSPGYVSASQWSPEPAALMQDVSFNVGDRVRLISKPEPHLRGRESWASEMDKYVGMTGEVAATNLDVSPNGIGANHAVKFDSGMSWTVMPDRLERDAPLKFDLGETVRIVPNRPDDTQLLTFEDAMLPLLGRTGTVVFAEDAIYDVEIDGKTWGYEAEWLQKVEQPAPEALAAGDVLTVIKDDPGMEQGPSVPKWNPNLAGKQVRVSYVYTTAPFIGKVEVTSLNSGWYYDVHHSWLRR